MNTLQQQLRLHTGTGMLQRVARQLALNVSKADNLRLLSMSGQLQGAAMQTKAWRNVQCSSFCSSSGWQMPHASQQPLQQLTQPQCRSLQLPLAAAAVQQAAAPAGQQWQQQRMLLGVVRHKNYQDHNTKKPKKYKIKTPSIVKRRVIVSDDGTMWRMQGGRRHKRYKKNRLRLLDLKGMVPLHGAHAAKLRKLGYKRNWWHTLKA